MKSVLVLSVILFIISLSLPTWAKVIELNKDNFNRTEKGTWLVKFYAPWCQHCKKLVPVWDEVANYYSRNNDIKVKVAKIDCEAYADVCTKEGATGFPTMKFYVDGIQKSYVGGRKKNDILNFVHKMNKPITIDMKAADVPNAFKQDIPSFILVGLNPSQKAKDAFTLVAKHIQDLVSPQFYFLNDKSIAKEYLADVPEGSIVMFREGDRKIYNGKIDFESFHEWAKENRFGYMNKYSEATYESFVNSGRLLVLCVTDTISPEQEKFSEDCKKVSKERADDTRYLFGGLDALQYDRYATSFGATPEILPTVIVVDDSNEIHYIEPANKYTSADKIESFLKEIEAGNVKSQTWSYYAYISKKMNKFGKHVWKLALENFVISISSSIILILFIVTCCLPSSNQRDKSE